MRRLLIAAALLPPLWVCGGCEAPTIQIGPGTWPATLPAELVRIEPGAVVLSVERGAVTVESGAVQAPLTSPPLPETMFDRLWLWVGIAAVAGVAGYWFNRWIRLAVRRVQGSGFRVQKQ